MPDDRDPHAALREALDGADPPASLREVDDAVVADLAAAITAAREEQARLLAASGEASLRHVPKFLRGPVKKVIGL
ncbi:hypothetical protein [Paraconexibacter sp.]|uniref:hypothetical protein n=1 Tax=Paraconexibacter sp. TaxID=2949640 RepID=UPI00356B12DA